MGQQVNEVINNLAQKLGVATNVLLKYLVKQQVAIGVTDIFVGIFILIVSIYACKKLIPLYKSDTDKYEWVEFAVAVAVVTAFILVPIFIKSGVVKIIAPEAEALENIISIIKYH